MVIEKQRKSFKFSYRHFLLHHCIAVRRPSGYITVFYKQKNKKKQKKTKNFSSYLDSTSADLMRNLLHFCFSRTHAEVFISCMLIGSLSPSLITWELISILSLSLSLSLSLIQNDYYTQRTIIFN